jgi:hypothetical protein
MNKHTRSAGLLTVAWAIGLGALAGACGPEHVPFEPTFATDVRPIMLSRCVRCHGGGGTLNKDPDHTGLGAGAAPIDGFFDRLEDDCPDGAVTGCHGLLHYATPPAQLPLYIHATSDDMRMPPPPSRPLSDLQLQVIDRWLADIAAGMPP